MDFNINLFSNQGPGVDVSVVVREESGSRDNTGISLGSFLYFGGRPDGQTNGPRDQIDEWPEGSDEWRVTNEPGHSKCRVFMATSNQTFFLKKLHMSSRNDHIVFYDTACSANFQV